MRESKVIHKKRILNNSSKNIIVRCSSLFSQSIDISGGTHSLIIYLRIEMLNY